MDEDIILFCDNRQALHIFTSEMIKLHTKLRHVDIHQMWLRQKLQNDRIMMELIGTDHVSADGFAKPLSHSKYEKFVKITGLRDITVKINNES